MTWLHQADSGARGTVRAAHYSSPNGSGHPKVEAWWVFLELLEFGYLNSHLAAILNPFPRSYANEPLSKVDPHLVLHLLAKFRYFWKSCHRHFLRRGAQRRALDFWLLPSLYSPRGTPDRPEGVF